MNKIGIKRADNPDRATEFAADLSTFAATNNHQATVATARSVIKTLFNWKDSFLLKQTEQSCFSQKNAQASVVKFFHNVNLRKSSETTKIQNSEESFPTEFRGKNCRQSFVI